MYFPCYSTEPKKEKEDSLGLYLMLEYFFYKWSYNGEKYSYGF